MSSVAEGHDAIIAVAGRERLGNVRLLQAVFRDRIVAARPAMMGRKGVTFRSPLRTEIALPAHAVIDGRI